MNQRVALVTGGAKRIGAGIVEYLHEQGMNIILHYRLSSEASTRLAKKLNTRRPNSVVILQMDLLNTAGINDFISEARDIWGYFDVLINNASSFYPTPLGKVTEHHWHDLMGSNLAAPFFLSQAAMPMLIERKGCIVNIGDIKGERPAKNYSVYSIAKAGLDMLTKSLAKEFAPLVRVNAIAPGAILRPENSPLSDSEQQKIPLQRLGNELDIAQTVYFLIAQAPYITGQIIAVDGGRSLFIASDNY
ncbi:MAG: pteridine reductase [bacterium]|nr:pteridine reductase [bacterium]